MGQSYAKSNLYLRCKYICLNKLTLYIAVQNIFRKQEISFSPILYIFYSNICITDKVAWEPDNDRRRYYLQISVNILSWFVLSNNISTIRLFNNILLLSFPPKSILNTLNKCQNNWIFMPGQLLYLKWKLFCEENLSKQF